MGLSSSHGRPKRSHRRHGRSLLLHAIFARWQLAHAWLIMPSTRRVVSTVASAAVVVTSNGSTLGGSCMLAASRRMQPFVGGKTLTGEAPTISGTSSDLWGQLYDVVRQADCSAGAVLGRQADCSAGAVLGRSGCAKATSEATTHLRCSTPLLVGSKLAALMPQCDECGGIVGGVHVCTGRGANSAPRRSLRACLKWFQNVTVTRQEISKRTNHLRE